MNKIFNFISLTAGLIIGSAVTYYYMENKYNNIINDIQKNNEEYVNTIKEDNSDKSIESTDSKKNNIVEYGNIINDLKYEEKKESDYTKSENIEGDPDIYPISDIDFDNGDYNVEYLTYYKKNNILIDESDIESNTIYTNIEEIVGPDFDEVIELMPTDSIIIRNDHKKIDYDIIVTDDDYYDILSDIDNQREDD